VDYSLEGTPLGTGEALKLASHMVDTKYCLAMNGDSYAEFDPVSLLTAHEKLSAKITLVVKPVVDSSRYGTVRMGEDNTIKAFTEKSGATEGGIINAGIYLINTTELQEIPDEKPCSLENNFFPRTTGKGLYSCEISGSFIDIGTPKSYGLAKKIFREPTCTPLITNH
jgi:D-glycero-alpha-D-manno-heptose 1-phosphate guanylyltransferase